MNPILSTVPRLDKSKTAAFTGHRFGKIYKRSPEVLLALCDMIQVSYEKGYRNFFCGMAHGVDLLAFQALERFKKDDPSIKRIAAIPCLDQSRQWDEEWKIQWLNALYAADHTWVYQEKYLDNKLCMFKRNTFMVENSSLVLGIFDESPKGGTAHTIAEARLLKKKVVFWSLRSSEFVSILPDDNPVILR